MYYEHIDTGERFPHSELAVRYPNTSIPDVLSQDDLRHLWLVVVPDPEPTAEQVAADLDSAKLNRAKLIWQARARADLDQFEHAGKIFACDALSRSRLGEVALSVAMARALPVGFSGTWKAVDGSLISVPSADAFLALYQSMVDAGMANFKRSQTLQNAIANAATVEQVNVIAWD